MKLRRNRPLLLIDLAVPRDIEPEVNLMPNVYLYNVDDFQAVADQSLKQRQAEIVRCEEIIREKAQALLAHPRPREQDGGMRPAYGQEA
jgi:glutamyl-tRNA reductase